MEAVVQETPSIKNTTKYIYLAKTGIKKKQGSLWIIVTFEADKELPAGIIPWSPWSPSGRKAPSGAQNTARREEERKKRNDSLFFLMVNIGNYKESDTKVTG